MVVVVKRGRRSYDSRGNGNSGSNGLSVSGQNNTNVYDDGE